MPNRIRIQNELVLKNRNVGIGTTLPTSKLSITQSSSSQALDIGSQLKVDGSGSFNPSITIGSTVGAGTTQKLNISVVSREGGLIEIENFGGNQLFSASNDQSGDLFNVYRYYQTGTSFIPIFQNRKLFGVSNLGDVYVANNVTGLGSFRLGNAGAASTIFNEIHSNLVLRPGFSTSITQSVYIVPKLSDRGAISFESPVGTAQTNRGNQIFSISNNFDTSIFRVNDLNRNTILEATATGNIGIGTANPAQKLQVIGNTRISSVGSTVGEQIDIRHYRNIAFQPTVTGFGVVIVATGATIGVSTTILTGISTSNVSVGLEIQAITNIISAGTTVVSVGSSQVGIGTTTLNSTQQNNISLFFGRTVGVATNNRGAISFDSATGISSNGIQLFPASLFAITNDPTGNIFSVGGYRYFSGSPFPVIDVTQRGRLGIGTTSPQTDFHINLPTFVSSNVGFGTSISYAGLDINTTTQFRGRVAFAQIGNPNNNSAIDLIPASSGFSTTGFGTYVPSGGAIVMTENRDNRSIKGAGNASQIFTVENNNNTLFRVNTVGIGLSTVSNPFSVYPVLDITGSGDVRIFDTETRKILTTAPGFSSTTPGDGDFLRIDTYVTPFIGSFPTVRKALLMNKFGDMEFYRNIITNITLTKDLYVLNQGVGIGTINIDSTRNVKLQVVGNERITSIGSTVLGQIDISHLSSSTLSPSGISTSGIYSGSPSRGSVIFSGIGETNLNGGQLVTITNDNTSSIFTVNRFIPGVSGLSTVGPSHVRLIETVVNVTSSGNVGIGTTTPTSKLHVEGNTLITGVTTITGNLNAAGNYYVKLARTTNQTISNSVDTLIGFSTITDPNNWYTGITTRTTPTVAGTYRVDAMLNWLAGSITNDQTNIQIRKNGTTFALSQVGIQTHPYTMNACGIVTMNGTTDYIDFTAYTSNPTSQDVKGTTDGAWTKLEIFKIN